ncbi:MAG: hypothetical protein ACOYL3_28300, partial [Desulfuromonadaceae bacterium]
IKFVTPYEHGQTTVKSMIEAQTLNILNGVASKVELEQKLVDNPEYVIVPGIKFCLHDLRRTFVTVAEGLEISYAALKRLMNHSDGNDVTGGYLHYHRPLARPNGAYQH